MEAVRKTGQSRTCLYPNPFIASLPVVMKKIGCFMKINPILISGFLMGAAHSATIIPITADQANSSPNAFGGTVEKTRNDPFAYDPLSPTSPLPNQVYNTGSGGYHANLAEGAQALVSYTTGSITTGAAEPVIIVDLYGRIDLACCNDRDDNIDVMLFNGDYSTMVASVTGLSIDNAADGWARASFDSLPVGTTFDRIRVVGNDSGGGPSNNYFTLLETRAASIAAVPEPTSAGLLALGVCAFLIRRRK